MSKEVIKKSNRKRKNIIEADVNSENHINEELEDHTKQLESLQSIDPGFYNFLREQDSGLLEFGDVVSKIEESEEEDENIDFSDDTEEIENLTEENLQHFETCLSKIKTIKLILKYFHTAIMYQIEQNEFNISNLELGSFEKFLKKNIVQIRFPSQEIINKLFHVVINKLSVVICQKLPKKKGKLYRNIEKNFLLDLVILLNFSRGTTDATLSILRCLKNCSSIFKNHPKVVRLSIKILLDFLSIQNKEIRILGFEFLKKNLLAENFDFFIRLLKRLYFNNERLNRYKNISSEQFLFLKVSLTTLLLEQPEKAYAFTFKIMKEVCQRLLKSLTDTSNKESRKTFLTWETINKLEIICFIIISSESEKLDLLVYPFIEINMAIIKNYNGDRYFPTTIHLLRNLVKIMEKFGTFIPLVPIFISLLKQRLFQKVGSFVVPANVKILPVDQTIKSPKDILELNAYRQAAFDEVYDSIVYYLIVLSTSISFPDLAFMFIKWIKLEVLTLTKVKRITQLLKLLINKIELVSKDITSKRQEIDYLKSNTEIKSLEVLEELRKTFKKENLPENIKKQKQKPKHLNRKEKAKPVENNVDRKVNKKNKISKKPDIIKDLSDSEDSM